ncbi:unnamed protein product [Pedinophyceae sp. YPF-701]|nr:unnamed protein product [Pedinophyceae sp. YPF-701]
MSSSCQIAGAAITRLAVGSAGVPAALLPATVAALRKFSSLAPNFAPDSIVTASAPKLDAPGAPESERRPLPTADSSAGRDWTPSNMQRVSRRTFRLLGPHSCARSRAEDLPAGALLTARQGSRYSSQPLRFPAEQGATGHPCASEIEQMDIGEVTELPGYSARVLPITLSQGAQLKLAFPGTNAIVFVKKSSRMDRVAVEVRSPGRETHSEKLEVTAGATKVTVLERKGANLGRSGLVQVTAWIPAGYCGLDVETGGGDVHVESIKEAGLTVKTYGGDIRVTAMDQGTHCHLDAGSGKIGGSFTAGDVSVVTTSGDVQLSRVMGRKVNIRSASGRVHCAFLYGTTLDVESGEGVLDILNMHGEDVAHARTHGQLLHLGGVEGRAEVDSGGGDVHMLLHDTISEVSVRSGGGSVRCSMAPSAYAHFEARAKDVKFVTKQLLDVKVAREADGWWRGSITGFSRPSKKKTPAPDTQATVRIDAGPEAVVVVEPKNWLEAVKDRFGQNQWRPTERERYKEDRPPAPAPEAGAAPST